MDKYIIVEIITISSFLSFSYILFPYRGKKEMVIVPQLPRGEEGTWGRGVKLYAVCDKHALAVSWERVEGVEYEFMQNLDSIRAGLSIFVTDTLRLLPNQRITWLAENLGIPNGALLLNKCSQELQTFSKLTAKRNRRKDKVICRDCLAPKNNYWASSIIQIQPR